MTANLDTILDVLIREEDENRAVFARLVTHSGLNSRTHMPVNVKKASEETKLNVKAAINRLIDAGCLERQPCVDQGARNNSYRILRDPTDLPNLEDVDLRS